MMRADRSLVLQLCRPVILFAWLTATVGTVSAAAPEHDIRIAFESDTGALEVHDSVRVSGRETYRFYLSPWLEIERVRLNGEAVEARPSGDALMIELPNTNQHQIEFEIAGRVPARGDASGHTSGAVGSFGADGSFLPAYAAWIPHDFAEPLSYRIEVTVAAPQRAVVTGKLVQEATRDGRYTVVVEQSRPGEAPSLFVGPYTMRELIRDDVRLRTYFHPGLDQGFAEAYLDAAGDYIARYRAAIGEYPYTGFHIVSAPLPVGFGFPGLTYIDRRIVPLPFMRSRSLAHEVLHNWWGNAVTVDYATGNWAEGLTTYMADYALARDQGEAAARTMRVKWLRDYAALPAERDRPVRAFRSKQHQAAQVIGYNKVAFIFHMLSQEIGEAAFDAGIRHFWETRRFARASWADLQSAFEYASKRDLDWFFRQWLDRSGAPRLSLAAHEVTRVDEGYLIRVEILQPVTGYRFVLPVALHTETGSERRQLIVESTRTAFEWLSADKPVAIHFDPDNDLFRRLTVGETPPILRDVTLNPATRTLIAADDPAFVDGARQLAARLMDTKPIFLQPGQPREARHPLLLIVPRNRLDARLSALGIELPDALPRTDHGAAVWTARFADGSPLLVVSAGSTDELRGLLRPLPHYGGQSFVLFEAGRALSRGVWQMERGPLYRDFAGG